MPRQPGYLTRKQVGQLNSDRAEYEDMKRRESFSGRTSTATRTVSRTVQNVGRQAGTSQGRVGIGHKLVFAVFAALVVLELATWATGRQYSIKLPPGAKPPGPPPQYRELYPGQFEAQAKLATKPATVPGVVH